MYEHEYEAMYGLEDIYWWFVARRELAVEILTREIGDRKGIRLLDVGCGTGSNLEAFSRFADATGIDMSTEALGFCHKRGVERVALSAVERLPFADGAFDIVTAMDMLEHTDDDLAALAELRRVLKPGGLLLVTVPAYGFLWSEHDEALKHRRRYTAHELRNKMTVTDFRIERTSYFITLLFFPILAMRIHQGLFKKSTHPQTSVRLLPGWINSSLVGLLGLERRLFRSVNLPFGVSIVALARPREAQRTLIGGVATASDQLSLPRSSTK
jgi:ubiquinone/menaquinone biosynthesis C-methylase UbiE